MSMDLNFCTLREVETESGTEEMLHCEDGDSYRPGRYFRQAVFTALPSQRNGEHLGSEYNFSKYDAILVVHAFYALLANIGQPVMMQDIYQLHTSVEAMTWLAQWAHDQDDDRQVVYA